MSNKLVSQLTELTSVDTASDKVPISDASDSAELKFIKPENLIPDSSATVKGKVELATSAETITGTDTVRAVTPAGAAATYLTLTGASAAYQPLDADLTALATHPAYNLSLNIAPLYAPQGFLINGKIVVTDAAGITVAIKTLAGTDPSATDPVYVRIGDTVRTISAALSVAKADGTNWMNAGSAELATKEIDYFVYLGYNATDGVVVGFSRYPGARSYDDFSATSTNEKYCAISTITTAAATDYYEVIGRFAATLSAGAGYTWSVPTYTAKNLIQRPIYETRWLDYVPQLSVSGGTAPTYTESFSNKYRISNKTLSLQQSWDNAAGGTAGNGTNPIIITTPFANAQYIANRSMLGSGFIYESTGSTNMFVMLQASGSASNYVLYFATATSVVGNDQSSTVRFKCAQGFYEI